MPAPNLLQLFLDWLTFVLLDLKADLFSIFSWYKNTYTQMCREIISTFFVSLLVVCLSGKLPFFYVAGVDGSIFIVSIDDNSTYPKNQ